MPYKDPIVNKKYKREWYRRSRFYKGGAYRKSARFVSYRLKKGPMAGYMVLIYGDTVRSAERLYEHRVIWEHERGPIPDGWEVHHANAIRDDNRIENLECLPEQLHKRLHGKLRGGLNAPRR